ncbi:MAG TPA: Wadjet anti-phage system protein JetD domain-containing protein [Anaerolineae bacterium]|nr:Wadjet anti-phage system protein JetD domain-containing protein [Anaerolineae bacterium]
MITPQEIKKKAHRKYLPFLSAILNDEPFFPLEIRFRKAKASDDYLQLKAWLADLLAHSKEEKGYGYTLTLEERHLRLYGAQSLPASICFTNPTDYLRYLGKEKEFAAWQTAVTHTLATFPQLKPWLDQNPKQILRHLPVWEDLLTVCTYFTHNPQPNLYPRQIPIPLHTKFIENHQPILRHLLDHILPPTAINPTQTDFNQRFGLRSDEPHLRFRLLDPHLHTRLNWPATDLTLPLSAAQTLTNLSNATIFIVENKMTFLTLPSRPNTLAIWGQGFQANLLAQLPWLAHTPIYYWGDLDPHGFLILAQLRQAWPQTKSFLMDRATLDAHHQYIVPSPPLPPTQLPNLTPDETALYHHLAHHNLRLEQEHIPQPYINHHLPQPKD